MGNNILGAAKLGEPGNPYILEEALQVDGVQARALDTSGLRTCAVQLDGTVRCWGSKMQGVDRSAPGPVRGLVDATEIAVGDYHACAIVGGGRLRCWGWNKLGQLGRGFTSRSDVIAGPVVELRGVKKVALGGYFTCALRGDGRVACWGSNNFGQVGVGSAATFYARPQWVPELSGVVDISAGFMHACAAREDGSLWCWGGNREGQLGNGTTAGTATPKPVAGLPEVVGTSSSAYATCAQLKSGSVMCMGENQYGEVSGVPSSAVLIPTQVPHIKHAKQLGLGTTACALLQNAELECWGARWTSRTGFTEYR